MAARPGILIAAIGLDLMVLAGFIWVKLLSDPLVLVVAGLAMAAILIAESLFLGRRAPDAHSGSAHDHHYHG